MDTKKSFFLNRKDENLMRKVKLKFFKLDLKWLSYYSLNIFLYFNIICKWKSFSTKVLALGGTKVVIVLLSFRLNIYQNFVNITERLFEVLSFIIGRDITRNHKRLKESQKIKDIKENIVQIFQGGHWKPISYSVCILKISFFITFLPVRSRKGWLTFRLL